MLVLDANDLGCERRDGADNAFGLGSEDDGNDGVLGIDLLAEGVPINTDGLVIFLAAGPGSKLVEVDGSEEVMSATISSSGVMAESLRLPADTDSAREVNVFMPAYKPISTLSSMMSRSPAAVSLSEGGGIACIAEYAWLPLAVVFGMISCILSK